MQSKILFRSQFYTLNAIFWNQDAIFFLEWSLYIKYCYFGVDPLHPSYKTQ